MKGLLYKDFQLILNKVSVTNRLLIVCALLLITNTYIHINSWLIDWHYVCSILTSVGLCLWYIWKHSRKYTGFGIHYGSSLHFAENSFWSSIYFLD